MNIILILSINLFIISGSQQVQDNEISYLEQKQTIESKINELASQNFNASFKGHLNIMIQAINLDEFKNIMFWIIVILAIGIFSYYFTLSLQKPRLTPSYLYSENLDKGSKIPLKQDENIQWDINIIHQRGKSQQYSIKLESVIKYSEQRIEDEANFNLNQKNYEGQQDSQL